MKVHLQSSKSTPDDPVSHTEQSVDVCPSAHLLNLARRIIYNSVPWPVIQGALGSTNHQVVHKLTAHAWPSKYTRTGHCASILLVVLELSLTLPARPPWFDSFSEHEQLKSTDSQCPWRWFQPSSSAGWKEQCVRKRQTTEVSLLLCI